MGFLRESVLEGREFAVFGQLDQQAQRKCFMDHGLADVENAGVVLGEDAGKLCSLAGVVLAGEVDENCLAHCFVLAYQRESLSPTRRKPSQLSDRSRIFRDDWVDGK